MSLSVGVEKRENSVYVVKLNGILDSETYMELEQKITDLNVLSAKTLVLDMGNLNYISSAGLGVIFKAKKAMEDKKGRFIMLNLQPQIRKVFDIVKALPHEAVFETMDEVDAYLDAMQKKEMDQKNPPQAS